MLNDALWSRDESKDAYKAENDELQVEDNRRRRLDPFIFFCINVIKSYINTINATVTL